MLVTDANRLQDFYGAVGAVYEGEDATVLPPPVPGGDEPDQDPQSGTASLYEGKEVVMLLGTTTTVALEAWTVSGEWGTVWFLQHNDDGVVRALEQDIDRALAPSYALTPEERSRFDLPLSELVRLIKEAAEHRATVTGGRIGEDPALPMLVNDANRLQDFCGAVGAVYEGEDATVLPPPVPGAGRTRTDSDLSR